ncbi:MAG: hypothetical protein HOO00_03875 [Rhodospirillaceae bacterium]|jgi:hypothetical protein|nr:hypothetical protein [Rhodospirillaceae bacterium]MBT5373872.1 hypothetical protein [Rhodospirillaceae bacterium]MBT5660158.1 hypothetical protein [Rhodospirillaceae bacterium]MBT5752668.1 hypothetical protein [Rhodospirillaceae bacterium]
MALSSIALASRALLKIGANTIASFEEGTAESEVAANLYPYVRDGMLSSYPWNFATAQMSLARLVAEPIADFTYAFQLPDGFLRALSAGQGGQGRGLNYRITGNRLHTDADSVVLTYIFQPDKMDFPPFFDQALITRLAAEFCIPLTENTSRTEALYKLAENEFRRAKLTDAQQDTPPAIEHFSLVDARS